MLVSGLFLIIFILNQNKTSIEKTVPSQKTLIKKLTPTKEELSPEDFKKILNEKDQISEEEFEEINQKLLISAIGKITNKQDDKITIEFSHLESAWSSIVSVDQNTVVFLPAPDANSMGAIVGLEELEIGDEVIVNSEENILNKPSFTATSIHKIK